MPSVERYLAGKRSDGRPRYRWRGRYYDAQGRKVSKSFDLKREALAWAGEQESMLARGQRTDPAGARMRWGDWCDRWWPAKTLEPGTRRREEPRLRIHVRPRWDDVALVDISRMDIQAWVNQLAEKRSASTTRHAYHLLSNSLRAAVAEGILASSPCVEIVLPTPPQGQERFLTDVEAGRLLYHLEERWRVFCELILGTGLRLAEACGLHAARVDLATQRLQVIETYDSAEGVVRGYPKSKRPRIVPLSDELAALLQGWLDVHPPTKTCGKPHRAGRCPGGMLIRGPQGGPISGPNFERRQWRTAVRHAGLEGVRVHDMRHTYASRLLQQGIAIERVQMLLGHSSVTTTARYAHLVADDWDAVRQALSTSVTAARAEADGPNLRAL